MYRLVVSPSIFRETYIDPRLFKWYLSAWWTALLITAANPQSEVIIQRKVSNRA